MEIRRTIKKTPPRIIIYGQHGEGKSTLASTAPKPVFIQTEDGLDTIDADAFPKASSYEDIIEQLTYIIKAENFEYKTLVIDSLDWCEKLVNEDICKQNNQESIGDFAYGAGYSKSFTYLTRILKGLDKIRVEKNMAIILIAHAEKTTFQNPLGLDYDYFKIKLREKNAAIFFEWVDCVGFLHSLISVKSEKGGFNKEIKKATGGSTKVFSCFRNPAFESKNRYGIDKDIIIPKENGFNNIMAEINNFYESK